MKRRNFFQLIGAAILAKKLPAAETKYILPPRVIFVRKGMIPKDAIYPGKVWFVDESTTISVPNVSPADNRHLNITKFHSIVLDSH